MAGVDPVRGYCRGLSSVVLLGSEPATDSLLVDPFANTHRLEGRVSFDLDCDTVVVGGSLSVIRQFDGPAVELRAPLITDATAVSPSGEQVVIVTAGFPVEVLSTLPADKLPHPWDSTTCSSGVVTALGERELFAGKDLVIAGPTEVLSRTPIPELTELAAARPDGTGALIVELGSKRILLADEHQAVPASNACDIGTLSYRPGIDFMRSYDAAEAQIPIADNGSAWTDCRGGRPLVPDRATQILSYDIGRIVARRRQGDGHNLDPR